MEVEQGAAVEKTASSAPPGQPDGSVTIPSPPPTVQPQLSQAGVAWQPLNKAQSMAEIEAFALYVENNPDQLTLDNIRKVISDSLVKQLDSSDTHTLKGWFLQKAIPMPCMPGKPDKARILSLLDGSFDPDAPVNPTQGGGGGVAAAQKMTGNVKFGGDWRRLADQYEKIVAALAQAGVPDVPGPGGQVAALQFFMEGTAMQIYRGLMRKNPTGYLMQDFTREFKNKIIPESEKSRLREALKQTSQKPSQSPTAYAQHHRVMQSALSDDREESVWIQIFLDSIKAEEHVYLATNNQHRRVPFVTMEDATAESAARKNFSQGGREKEGSVIPTGDGAIQKPGRRRNGSKQRGMNVVKKFKCEICGPNHTHDTRQHNPAFTRTKKPAEDKGKKPDIVCFVCNEKGHIARNCPKKDNSKN